MNKKQHLKRFKLMEDCEYCDEQDNSFCGNCLDKYNLGRQEKQQEINEELIKLQELVSSAMEFTICNTDRRNRVKKIMGRIEQIKELGGEN